MKTKAVIENGFKETEIGLIPEDWETTTLENEKLFEFANGLWKGKKVPFVTAKVIRNTNFNNDGTLFLDDVAELDVEEKQFIKRQLLGGDIILERSGGGPKQPVGRVVFFDLKEVNYSFSNFTTRIRVKDINKIQPKYILYYLLHFYNRGCTYELQQRTTGIRNLNFKDYKKIQVPLPSLTEQRKIAFVLLKIQQAIEQQHKIIETTRELKESLMYKLFTEGLNGEEQKETEIGLIPKSWRIETVINIVEKTKQKNPSQNPELTFKYIDVSGISNEFYKIIEYRTYNGSNAPSRARKLVQTDDVLFATVRPTLRRMAYIDEKYNGEICSTAFCVLRSKKSILSSLYLYYCVQRDEFIEELAKLQRGASYPAITDNDVKRQQIPLPSFREQNEITDILSSIDKKISQAESKKQSLQVLFKTMLNQLMTGKVRVKDFDFEVKENV
jgi:type I restriction enzyme S subunit